jgi:aerobic carbon-monoxide dehydrogenase medium subunit
MSVQEYFRPSTLDEAFDLLKSYAGSVKLLAGGTDLLIQSSSTSSPKTVVVSLRDLETLKQIRQTERGDLFIGSMVTHADVANSPLINRYFPALSRASRWVGSPSIRNLATIGGNICNASPSADTAPPLLAYEAKATIVTPAGEKWVHLEDFFTGPSLHVLKPGEILEGFLLTPKTGWVAAYEKLGIRKAMEIALVNVCVTLSTDGNKRCSDIRIALGAVAPTPIRARKAEGILKGQKIVSELIERSAKVAADETRPISDIRASADYRREMVHFMVKKVVSDLSGNVTTSGSIEK